MPVLVSHVSKSALATMVIVAVILAANGPAVHAQEADSADLDQISSQRYIVIDDQTGEIYAQKDADVRGGMASLTKVFTAVVALERAPLDMQITAQDSDVFDSTSTRMSGFSPGTTFTLRDLLYGMLLESGNDAAHAVARGVGAQPGDSSDEEGVERFVGWMNDKVAGLGLRDTHFVNPHGLSDPDHYSTPRDIASFMMYASRNADFMAIITARTYTTSTGVELMSVNRGPEFIPDYIGGKTGYDDATGYCLIEIGQRDDAQLVSVTIDGVAPDVWYQDHAILLDYGFAARSERIAAGDPVGDNVLAFAQQSDVDQTQEESAETEDEIPADDAFAGVDTAPRPVLVTGTPAPVNDLRASSKSPFDNWFIGLVIAIVVGGALWMHSGMRLRYLMRKPPTGERIDT